MTSRNQKLFLGGMFGLTGVVVCLLTGCTMKSPAHGTLLVVALDTNYFTAQDDPVDLLSQTQVLFEKRLKRLNLRSYVEHDAESQLLIKFPPGKSGDLALARQVISKMGRLEFRLVHPESAALLSQGSIPSGYEVLDELRVLPDGTKNIQRYLVKKTAELGLTGQYIKEAVVARVPSTQAPVIEFEFNPEGAALFAAITRQYQPGGSQYHQLGIVLDGELYSAPRIMGPIENARGQITGSFTAQEAFELANVLCNPLPVPVRIVREEAF